MSKPDCRSKVIAPFHAALQLVLENFGHKIKVGIKMTERAGFARHAPGTRRMPGEPAVQQGSSDSNTT
jgi:hypothetical protein